MPVQGRQRWTLKPLMKLYYSVKWSSWQVRLIMVLGALVSTFSAGLKRFQLLATGVLLFDVTLVQCRRLSAMTKHLYPLQILFGMVDMHVYLPRLRIHRGDDSL